VRENNHLRVGALVRHADVVASALPTGAVAAAAKWVSDPLIRNLGTLCGSVSHCDPEGDWNSVLLATGADVIATGPNGERAIAITDFVRDIFTNALEPDEMVTAVDIAVPAGRAGGTYLKLERKVGDYATVAAAIYLELNNGSIGKAGIALTSVGLTNIKATAAEASLVGAAPGDEVFADAGRLAAEASSPVADVRGSAEYKKHMVEVYVRRGLASAFEMAGAA